jgi:hypothetical protein
LTRFLGPQDQPVPRVANVPDGRSLFTLSTVNLGCLSSASPPSSSFLAPKMSRMRRFDSHLSTRLASTSNPIDKLVNSPGECNAADSRSICGPTSLTVCCAVLGSTSDVHDGFTTEPMVSEHPWKTSRSHPRRRKLSHLDTLKCLRSNPATPAIPFRASNATFTHPQERPNSKASRLGNLFVGYHSGGYGNRTSHYLCYPNAATSPG